MAFECKRSLACCKRYWIKIIPSEAQKIADFLNEPIEDFIKDRTVLFVRIFPSGWSENKLNIFSGLLSKELIEKIKEKTSDESNYYTVLPMLALKKEGQCLFLNEEERNCKIHEVKPEVCKLFPFIGLDGKKAREVYSFCKGLENCEENTKSAFEIDYYSNVKEYFDKVKKEGFSKTWKVYPSKGILLYKDAFICKINEKEFVENFLDNLN